MIPNVNHQTFLPYLRRTIRRGDFLLISANLSPNPYPDAIAHIAPQYDNPHAHIWYSGLLESLGFPMSQVSTAVQAVPLREDGHIWQLRVYTTCLEAFTLEVYDEFFPSMPMSACRFFSRLGLRQKRCRTSLPTRVYRFSMHFYLHHGKRVFISVRHRNISCVIEVHHLAHAIHGANFVGSNDMGASQHRQNAEKRLCRATLIFEKNFWGVGQDIKRWIAEFV